MAKILAFIFCITASFLSFAEGFSVISTNYSPRDFFVGDRVDLRILLTVDPQLTIAPPDSLPVQNWIELHSVQIVPYNQNFEVRIRLTPYFTGTRSLPALKLGDVLLSSVRIHTNSLVSFSSEEIRPIKGPFFLPGTSLIFVLLILFIIIGPFIGIVSFGFMKKRALQLIENQKRKRPLKVIQQSLRVLKSDKIKLSGRDFFYHLTLALRKYLTARTDFDFLSVTVKEFHNTMYIAGIPEDLTKPLMQWLNASDEIKFGGSSASVEQKDAAIKAVEDLLKFIESRIIQDAKKNKGAANVDSQ